MSTALSEAFARAVQLSEADQEILAQIVLVEVDELSRQAGPESPLAKLGREAWGEHEAGRTIPLP